MNCSHHIPVKLTKADEPAIEELLAKYPLWKRKDAMRQLRLRKFREQFEKKGVVS